MKLIGFFFSVGIIVGIILIIVRIRKSTPTNYKPTFECTICDANNCDCHKKDE